MSSHHTMSSVGERSPIKKIVVSSIKMELEKSHKTEDASRYALHRELSQTALRRKLREIMNSYSLMIVRYGT